jgi:hypothetical protein
MEGCNFILSINFDAVHDGPYYQKLKTDIADFAAGERSFQEEIGLDPSNVGRVILSANLLRAGREGNPLVIIRTRKPVTAADIRASRKAPNFKKDLSYNEIKVGEQTIVESTFHYSFDQTGELQHGDAFAVVEDNMVLFGQSGEVLRKVLARGKQAELSPELQKAVKDVDFAKTMVLIVLKAAVNETTAREFQNDFGPLFGNAINSEFLKKLESVSLEASLKGSDAVVRGSLAIKDAQSASDVKKVVEAAQIALRGKLQAMPRVPKDVLDAIDGVKFAVEGAKVNAAGQVKADPVVQWIKDEYNYQKAVGPAEK